MEVETGQFVPNFTDSVLIHRKLIEDLNAEIKVRGRGEGRKERGGRRVRTEGGRERKWRGGGCIGMILQIAASLSSGCDGFPCVSACLSPSLFLAAGHHMQDLGKGKLGIMKECKEFKKGIHMLEW